MNRRQQQQSQTMRRQAQRQQAQNRAINSRVRVVNRDVFASVLAALQSPYAFPVALLSLLLLSLLLPV